jgi:hypothetical protein
MTLNSHVTQGELNTLERIVALLRVPALIKQGIQWNTDYVISVYGHKSK